MEPNCHCFASDTHDEIFGRTSTAPLDSLLENARSDHNAVAACAVNNSVADISEGSTIANVVIISMKNLTLLESVHNSNGMHMLRYYLHQHYLLLIMYRD